MGLLAYGIPILLGILFGFTFTVWVNVVMSIVLSFVAIGALASTYDKELGGLIGIIVAVEIGIFLSALWVTIGILAGFSIDLSWLLR